MPRLPSVDQFQRATPQSTGGVVGYRTVGTGGVEGQSLAQTAAQFQQVYQQEQDRIDKTRAEEAFNTLRSKQLDLTIGDAEGFRNKRGSDAINTPLMPEYLGKFDSATQDIESSLGNDRQKELFRQRANVSQLQFKEDLLQHLQKESGTQAQQVFAGTLDVETQNATANWHDPQAVALSQERIRNAVAQEANRLGSPPEATAATMRDAESKVHAAVIGQALASNDIQYAKEWFDKFRDQIDVGTAKATEHAVRDAEQKQLSNGYRSDFIGARDDMRGLRNLEASIQKDEVLDEDRKNALLGPIASRMDVLMHRAEMRRDQTMRQVERMIGKLENMTLQGFEVSPDQALAVLSMTKGTELEAQGKQLVQTAAATREFRLSTPARQEGMLTALESNTREHPSPERVELLGKFKTIADNQKRQIQDSPVKFAFDQGLAQPQNIDFSNPEAVSDQINQQIQVARGMNQVYGAPVKPLLPEQVRDIRARLDRASPEQKMEWFGGLRRSVGADASSYSAMMSQVAPDDPVLAIAGEFSGKGRSEPARLMLQGQELLRPKTKEDGKPDQGKLWPMPADKDLRSQFQSAEGDVFAGKGAFRDASYQATLAIYAKMSEEAGDTKGVLDSNRFEKAMKMAVGEVTGYRGRQTILPYGMEYSDFKRSMNLRIDDIVRTGRLAEGVNSSKLRDMPVDAIGDGRYSFRVGSGYLVDKNGKRVEVNFNLEPSEAPPEKAPTFNFFGLGK